VLEGSIARAAAGAEGFGFDPVFVPEGETRTVAELGDAWKSRHSHRARAAGGLGRLLRARG
jgi:XTP/dITP diphosphohydrolase